MRRRSQDNTRDTGNVNRRAIVAGNQIAQGRVFEKLLVASWNVDKIALRKVDRWTDNLLRFATRENIQDIFIGQQEASIMSKISNLPEGYHSVATEKLIARTKDVNKSFVEMITSRDANDFIRSSSVRAANIMKGLTIVEVLDRNLVVANGHYPITLTLTSLDKEAESLLAKLNSYGKQRIVLMGDMNIRYFTSIPGLVTFPAPTEFSMQNVVRQMMTGISLPNSHDDSFLKQEARAQAVAQYLGFICPSELRGKHLMRLPTYSLDNSKDTADCRAAVGSRDALWDQYRMHEKVPSMTDLVRDHSREAFSFLRCYGRVKKGSNGDKVQDYELETKKKKAGLQVNFGFTDKVCKYAKGDTNFEVHYEHANMDGFGSDHLPAVAVIDLPTLAQQPHDLKAWTGEPK